MMDEPVRSLWSGLLTALGAILFWNGRQVVKTLAKKANQKDLDDHKNDVENRFIAMQLTINRVLDAQADQHKQNSERLDKIFTELCRRP